MHDATGSTYRASTTTTVYTIGHSTRPIEEFLDLLRRNGVGLLADIRTIPKSRRNPQYWHDALAASLAGAGIAYRALPALGGRRRTTPDSINTAWRNLSFRGYADYMQTDAFAAGVDQLVTLAVERTTAIMCAEAVPWRCHRSLVGDALLARGVRVLDIISATSVRPHALTPWARVAGTTITYPGDM
ncbi:MAG TPA: DUF488 domain-containing protein [Thermomicrobiales bacterium]|nr:DUF488 domain-containing protein [Thermomicrobiales bacterium]